MPSPCATTRAMPSQTQGGADEEEEEEEEKDDGGRTNMTMTTINDRDG